MAQTATGEKTSISLSRSTKQKLDDLRPEGPFGAKPWDEWLDEVADELADVYGAEERGA